MRKPILYGRNYARGTFRRKHAELASMSPEGVVAVDEILSLSDLADGTILAFVLAFSYSYLQRDSSSVILWRRNEISDDGLDFRDGSKMKIFNDGLSENGSTNDEGDPEANLWNTKTKGSVFDERSWTEMSRPENYIFFNKREGRRDSGESNSGTYQKENKTILIGLLLLFVPLFSAEFFFALSRQFICGGDPFTQSELANVLCSAHQ